METALKQQTDLNPDCLKVVFYGPESTGKSVMAKLLASEYNAGFVPEYSRIYAENKHLDGESLSKADVLPIAVGQMFVENHQLKYAKELLICDTDLLQTKVYSELYYEGYCPPELQTQAVDNHYDCYFLCYIDTEWVADGIRDRPEQRLDYFKAFEAALIAAEKPYITLKGSFESKLETCRKQIDNLIKTHK